MTEQKEILSAENEMFKTDLTHKNQIIAEARQRIYEWKQYSEHLENNLNNLKFTVQDLHHQNFHLQDLINWYCHKSNQTYCSPYYKIDRKNNNSNKTIPTTIIIKKSNLHFANVTKGKNKTKQIHNKHK